MLCPPMTRAKNMSSILVKSLIDTFITAICYYCVGYALTIGKGSHVNRESRDVETGLWGTGMGTHVMSSLYRCSLLFAAFIGTTDFALSESASYQNSNDRLLFVWNWVFCAASTTIMAGSIAERSSFVSYVIFAIFYSSWVYPVPAYWTWSHNGWLSPFYAHAILGSGAIDFAGSGEVQGAAYSCRDCFHIFGLSLPSIRCGPHRWWLCSSNGIYRPGPQDRTL